MPCNRAVSIARAQLTDAQALKLLDNEDFKKLLHHYGQQQGLALTSFEVARPGSWNAGTVTCNLGYYRITITPSGAISVQGRSSSWAERETCDRYSVGIAALLKEGGFQATARAAAEVLTEYGPTTTEQQPVDDQGTIRQAIVLTLRY
jgi:hypothetical protein